MTFDDVDDEGTVDDGIYSALASAEIEAVKLTLSPWAAWIVRRQQIAGMRIVGGEQHIPGAPMVTQ